MKVNYGLIVFLHVLIMLFCNLECQCQALKQPQVKSSDQKTETQAESELISIAKKFFNSKQYDSTLLILNKALGTNPSNIRALYYLAKTSIEVGDFDGAIKYSLDGLNYESNYYEHFAVCLGESFIGLGKYVEARNLLIEAASTYPNNDRVLYQLGRVYNKTNKYDSAETPLAVSVALSPQLPEYHFELARTYHALNEYMIVMFPLITYLSFDTDSEFSTEAFIMLDHSNRFFESKDTVVNLNTDSLFKDNPFLALEMAIKTALVSTLKSNEKVSKIELQLKIIEMLLNMISNSYSKDFDKYQNILLFRIYYKYLGDIHKKGYSKAFAYYIYSKVGNEEALNWVNSNQDKVDAFRKWVQEYNWDI